MKIINLDGTTLCITTRDADGVHIGMLENQADKIKSGEIETRLKSDCPKEYDYRIDICDKTYIALVKSLLSFAEREELVRILCSPLDGACWSVGARKSKKEHKQ